jgi:membrane-associated phospholipid phosphatase
VVITVVIALLLPAACPGQSPYTRSWERDGPVAVATLSLGLGAWLVHDDLTRLTPEEVAAVSRADVNPLDRAATRLFSNADAVASDWLLYSLIAAPLAMLADREVRDDWQTFLLMYAETLALNGGAGQFVKGVTQRTRPYVYNPAVPMEMKTTPNARKSFYSSHTSFAFSSAVFLTTTLSGYVGDARYVPYTVGAAFLGAAAVGILRYTSGRHFPTDILVGALVGSLVGWSIPAIHRSPAEPSGPSLGVTIALPL